MHLTIVGNLALKKVNDKRGVEIFKLQSRRRLYVDSALCLEGFGTDAIFIPHFGD